MPVRIALAEVLTNFDNDHGALVSLGTILDTEPMGPFRIQAINALTYVGARARPVLPAIHRSAVKALDGTYDPHRIATKPGGGMFPNPEQEGEDSSVGRPYG